MRSLRSEWAKGVDALLARVTARNSTLAQVLANRYLIAAGGPSNPAAFTVASPTIENVAAVNVVRRGSGIFLLMVQMDVVLSGADTHEWSASAQFGSVASGGSASGQWRYETGGGAGAIALTAASAVSPMAAFLQTVGAGNLHQTVVLTGVNSNPVPAGASALLVAATTLGGATITPGGLFAFAQELP